MAMKLIADRPALVADAISGFGTVGNDIVGKGLPFYDTSLPAAHAGHRPGEVAAEGGRTAEPDGHDADLGR